MNQFNEATVDDGTTPGIDTNFYLPPEDYAKAITVLREFTIVALSWLARKTQDTLKDQIIGNFIARGTTCLYSIYQLWQTGNYQDSIVLQRTLVDRMLLLRYLYLISSRWVIKVSDDRTFTTKSGTQLPRSIEWYVITAKGVDRIEGSTSDFMRQNPYSNVNITAVNSAVQLGSVGSDVNSRHQTFHAAGSPA